MSNTANLLLGDGNGALRAREAYLYGDSAFPENTMALAEDVNGDGRLDLLTSGVSVFLDEGAGVACQGATAVTGPGCPGSQGFVPSLTAEGCPTPGSAVTLCVSLAYAPTTGVLFLGSGPGPIPLGPGCALYVGRFIPPLPVPISGVGAGTGSLQVAAVVPASVPPGTSTYLQVLLFDPGVGLGFSASNGLRIDIQ